MLIKLSLHPFFQVGEHAQLFVRGWASRGLSLSPYSAHAHWETWGESVLQPAF